MAVFLIVLFALLVVYIRAAMQLPTLPPDETPDGEFNSMRLLSEPSMSDPQDALERMLLPGAAPKTESDLQRWFWPLMASLLIFIWWRARDRPSGYAGAQTIEKVAPLPVKHRPWLPAAVLNAYAAAPADTFSAPEPVSDKSIALPDSQLRVLPGFILKLAEYSQPDGVQMLGTVFPTENIEALHVGAEEYWAGILYKTYGEARRALERWERCRPQWEPYGIRPEIVQLQGV